MAKNLGPIPFPRLNFNFPSPSFCPHFVPNWLDGVSPVPPHFLGLGWEKTKTGASNSPWPNERRSGLCRVCASLQGAIATAHWCGNINGHIVVWQWLKSIPFIFSHPKVLAPQFRTHVLSQRCDAPRVHFLHLPIAGTQKAVPWTLSPGQGTFKSIGCRWFGAGVANGGADAQMLGNCAGFFPSTFPADGMHFCWCANANRVWKRWDGLWLIHWIWHVFCAAFPSKIENYQSFFLHQITKSIWHLNHLKLFVYAFFNDPRILCTVFYNAIKMWHLKIKSTNVPILFTTWQIKLKLRLAKGCPQWIWSGWTRKIM